MTGEEVGDIFREGKAYDVQVWSTPESRDSLTAIRQLPIDTPDGGIVRLEEVADVTSRPPPNSIQRQNGSAHASTSAPTSRAATSARWPRRSRTGSTEIELPPGYHAEVLGRVHRSGRQRRPPAALLRPPRRHRDLLPALLTSFRKVAPGGRSSFFTLPMALVGGVLAAFFFGDGIISLGSLVGFFTVLGIVARNGIMHDQPLPASGGATRARRSVPRWSSAAARSGWRRS